MMTTVTVMGHELRREPGHYYRYVFKLNLLPKRETIDLASRWIRYAPKGDIKAEIVDAVRSAIADRPVTVKFEDGTTEVLTK